MKFTKEFIEERFTKFNKLIFRGQLPMPAVELRDVKTYMGACRCSRRRKPSGKTELFNFRLSFSTRADLPENELEDIIIHEMIHYYIGLRQWKDSSAHGEIFKRWMSDINRNYGRHVSISHKTDRAATEQMQDQRRRWHVVAVVTFKDGRQGIKVLPRIAERIAHYQFNVGLNPSVATVILYMTDNPFFNRFPNSAALKVHLLDSSAIEENLREASPIPSPTGEGF